MATLATIGNFYNVRSGALFERFLGGVLHQIVSILAEAPEIENHAARVVWANAQLAKTEDELTAEARVHFRVAIAGNAAIQASLDACSDGDIDYVVSTQINAGY